MPALIYWLGAYADFVTTRKGLAAGFNEGNPVVKYVLDKLPFNSEMELMALKIGVYLLMVAVGAPAWVFYGLGALQLLAAAHNYRLLKKARVI